jgi:Protein of unknown function (DUF3617)
MRTISPQSLGIEGKMRSKNLWVAALVTASLWGCNSGSESDTDGDGKISKEERAQEMAQDGYLPMQPGRWKIAFKFNEIDVSRLGNKEKQDILKELESQTSGLSCLSAAQASKPGADFFGGKGAEDCTYKKFDIAGNRVTMQVACGMGGMGKAEMDLDGTVGDMQFDYDTKLAVSIPLAGKIKLSGKMTGTHEGKCQGNE